MWWRSPIYDLTSVNLQSASSFRCSVDCEHIVAGNAQKLAQGDGALSGSYLVRRREDLTANLQIAYISCLE